MAVGKNKGLQKSGKKGQKKNKADPFLKKIWYDIKAPVYFNGKRKCGKTIVSKTAGLKVETEGLKGRICEFNLADLKEDHDGHKSEDGHKKIKLEIQDVTGKTCLTDFYGMGLTRDKMASLIKKKHSLLDMAINAKTSDGFGVRIFVIAFTKKCTDKNDPNIVHQKKQFCYAQSAQIKKIRKRMTKVLQEEIGNAPLKDMVTALCVDKYESKIKDETNRIFPLDPVHIYKVKMVKKPKMDITKLWEIHDKDDDKGFELVPEAEEAKNLLN